MTKSTPPTIPAELIERKIYLIHDQRVMLDADLANLYGVENKKLVQAVKRNIERFPEDFMFQLSQDEYQKLRTRFATSVSRNMQQNQLVANLRSQFVTSSLQAIDNTTIFAEAGFGGRRTMPYCFTEQGVTMLSAVLRSPRAIAVSIEVVRTFVKLRQMLASNLELARKLAALEGKYDEQFKVVFDAIRELMTPPSPKKKAKIGF